MGLLDIFKDEEGEGIAITIKDSDGINFVISWIVVADTTIVIKTLDLKTTKLTVTNANFAVATPVITWTPDTADIATSLGVGEYIAFVHLRDNSNTREVIAKFHLQVHDN